MPCHVSYVATIQALSWSLGLGLAEDHGDDVIPWVGLDAARSTSDIFCVPSFTAVIGEGPETFLPVVRRVACPGCRVAQLSKPGDPKIGARVWVESGGALVPGKSLYLGVTGTVSHKFFHGHR